jgi:hypothetical protein
VARTERRTYSLGRSASFCSRSSFLRNASNAESMKRIQLGTHDAPCSITPSRSVGKRSSTPSKISVAIVCIGAVGIAM